MNFLVFLTLVVSVMAAVWLWRGLRGSDEPRHDRTCPHCRSTNRRQAVFCATCGTRLP